MAGPRKDTYLLGMYSFDASFSFVEEDLSGWEHTNSSGIYSFIVQFSRSNPFSIPIWISGIPVCAIHWN